MLYTRFVIGDEALSRTSAFNFSYWAIFSNAINFIHFVSVTMGINGHLDVTSWC